MRIFLTRHNRAYSKLANYVMLFLRYTLCFNSVLSYFFLIQFGFDDGIDVAILP